ncbi:glycosyltransferase family 2 protein [Bradyrhizobium sp. Pear76]|uniref:tetratricopeptide repeat-containing glycosyltransferase n=1 Tax=Bradyrhizobium oropedii TaxID=1571201 RepID=UPI001E59729D|nr:glycosyltransferase family 2 protein [Bradyrhizobium oropedii]MCC8966296.1 glycosyltransferase family 2 protein [Bradyrhizobium oropedii]
MKVAVYTIALNEFAHVERWANSALDADYRVVIDTGSTDGTVERLERSGVIVHRVAINPWRFDVARNTAMALLPPDVDICCSMDMDRYLEPGWRPKLEAAWTPDTTALFCRTVYRASPDDPTILRGWPTKNFHHRWGYRFTRPVHEALSYSGQEVTRDCLDIVMCEVQDLSKETRRQYLSLMELAHQEDPDDAQICFWLARDYMWSNRAEEASKLFQHYLSLPTSTWNEERSEAMRLLARTEPDKAVYWLDKARAEASHRREIWLDLAENYHDQSDWHNLYWACGNGIDRTRKTNSYLDDNQCWGIRIFELATLAAWRLGFIVRARDWAGQALQIDPVNQRLLDRFDFFSRLANAPPCAGQAPTFAQPPVDPHVAEGRWASALRDAHSLRDLGDNEGFIRTARDAFRMLPHRAEPLHELANFYLASGQAELAASYAEAALCLPFPKSDTIAVDEDLYKTGPRHAFSVAANWSRDPERKERGRKICDWLALSRDTPYNVRKTARYNSGWYAPSIQSLLPSVRFHQLSIQAPNGFVCANIGICRREHAFAITLRAVNYSLLNGYHVKGDDPSYRSRMLLASLSEDFQVGTPVEVRLPDDLPSVSTEALGFEDPRPFMWRGSLWCVSSVRQLNAEARPEMVLARIDDSNQERPMLMDWRVLNSGVPPRWEKNWMPLIAGDELRLIYALDPTRILSSEGDELVNEPAEVAAETFLGGSQAVPYETGWLSVIHEYEWVDNKRRYFHRFIWLDQDGRLRRFSRRFYMTAPGYEFVAGMAWDHQNQNLLVSFSVNDRELFLAAVQPRELAAILIPISEHRQASDDVIVDGKRALRELFVQPDEMIKVAP